TAIFLMIYVYFYAKKNNIIDQNKVTKGEFINAVKQSILPLGLPIVILGGILLGIFTATESASIAVVYAFILSRYIYKELNWENIKQALLSTVINTGSIMILIDRKSTRLNSSH